MRTLAANLKTLYQCPAMWFWHLVGVVFLIDGVVKPVVEPVAGQGEFMKFLILSYWAGMATASLMKETLGKPVTFCLPGHQRALRGTIFAVGGAQALLLAPIVLAYPGLDLTTRLAGMASVGCLTATIYLLSVSATFLMSNAAAFWGVPAIFLGLSRQVFTGVRSAIEDGVIFHPWIHAAVLIPVALLTWHRLGRRTLARRECGTTFLALQYLWNRPVLERYNRELKIRQLERRSKKLWGFMERRFLGRVRRLPAYSSKRYLAGSRYVLLGGALPTSPAFVLIGTLVTVIFLVILGFAVPSEDPATLSRANFLYLLPAIVGIMVQIPLYSTLLLPVDRRARFRTCVAVGVRGAALLLLLSAALFAISLAVATLLPEITLSGDRFVYVPMDPELLLAPLIVLPFLFTCQLGFPRGPQIPQTVILVIAVGFAAAAPGVFGKALLPVLGVLTALSWWCFVGPLHHFCYHRDLALK
jgi:hypothetical protein